MDHFYFVSFNTFALFLSFPFSWLSLLCPHSALSPFLSSLPFFFFFFRFINFVQRPREQDGNDRERKRQRIERNNSERGRPSKTQEIQVKRIPQDFRKTDSPMNASTSPRIATDSPRISSPLIASSSNPQITNVRKFFSF